MSWEVRGRDLRLGDIAAFAWKLKTGERRANSRMLNVPVETPTGDHSNAEEERLSLSAAFGFSCLCTNSGEWRHLVRNFSTAMYVFEVVVTSRIAGIVGG